MSTPSAPSEAAPKGKKRQAREREIVEAAERVFGRAGYWNATTAAIAAEVGITQPALYRYFKSKRDLFMAALAFRQRDLQDVVAAALAEPGTSSEKLVRIARGTTAVVLAHPEMAMLRIQAIAVAAQDEEIRAIVQSTMSQLRTGHEAMIAAAIAEGTLDESVDPFVLAVSISGLALVHYVAVTIDDPIAETPVEDDVVARLLKVLEPKQR